MFALIISCGMGITLSKRIPSRSFLYCDCSAFTRKRFSFLGKSLCDKRIPLLSISTLLKEISPITGDLQIIEDSFTVIVIAFVERLLHNISTLVDDEEIVFCRLFHLVLHLHRQSRVAFRIVLLEQM